MPKFLLIIPDRIKWSVDNIPSYRLFYVTRWSIFNFTIFFSGAGASPNVQRKDDLWTPLFVAAMLGRTQVANMLLQVSFLQEIKQKLILINLFKKTFVTVRSWLIAGGQWGTDSRGRCQRIQELQHCWHHLQVSLAASSPDWTKLHVSLHRSGTSALLTSSPGRPRH